MSQKEALEVTGMLLVFLELYCDMNEEAIYSIDMMTKESYFTLNITELFCTENLRIKMEQFYNIHSGSGKIGSKAKVEGKNKNLYKLLILVS